MLNSVILKVLFSILFLVAVNGQNYDEKYRLQVHYSVPSAWSNDPNGLIYAGGYYHLFYQFNPNEMVWGPMHWAHARSKDLIHWENMPIAMEPYNDWWIFSGCCVIDKTNVAGFASERSNSTNQSEDTLIAIFTLRDSNDVQSQGLAYSFDAGTTWTQYENNPALPNPRLKDFRDPMVFQRNGQFYMTLVLGNRIRFYSSTDLKTWKIESEFGVNPDKGDKSGFWECPSMVTLKDEQGTEHDVLIVSEDAGDAGSLSQYFVGQFIDNSFNSYNQSKVLWFDNGFDNYASIPYTNDPFGRIIMIGWMSNWFYADQIPTSTWRGQYTIPRELSLKTVDGKLYLAQQPILELDNIIDPSRTWSLSKPMKISGYQTLDLTKQIPFQLASAYILDFAYDIRNVTQGNFSIRFSNSFDEFISFRYYFSDNSIEFDRSNSGNFTFPTKETKKTERISTSNIFTGKVILDASSVEKFVDDGLNTITNLFFPSEPYNKIQLFTEFENAGESITVLKLDVACLNSIWK